MYRKEKSPFVPVISWISLYAHCDRGGDFRVRTCRTFRSFFSSIALRIIEEKRRENKKKKKKRRVVFRRSFCNCNKKSIM